MWVLLSARLRRWVLVSVALPLLSALARRLGDRIEKRKGSTRLSRALRRIGSLTSRPAKTSRPPNDRRPRRH